MKNFGSFLYNLRINAGLSLQNLGPLVGSSRSSLSRLENGLVPQPFRGSAHRLAVDLAEILCTKHEISRYMELAEIDHTVLTRTEQIQLGFASAISGSFPDDISALEHTRAIYRELLARLEARKAKLGDATPTTINLKIQDYTRGLDAVQKRIDDINSREERKIQQQARIEVVPEEVTSSASDNVRVPTSSPIPSLDHPLMHNDTLLAQQGSVLIILNNEQKRMLASLLALDSDLLTGTLEGSDTERSRRAFLRQVFTLAGTSLAVPTDHTPFIESSKSIISDDLIMLFEGTMASHWELYHTGGAIRIVHGLDLWVKEIVRLSQQAQGTNWQKRILKLLTMSYQLQSCVLRDIMDYSQAHTAYQRAFHVAQELEDVELMASALAREGVTHIQQDKPKQAIIYLDGALTTIEGHVFPKLRGHILQALSEANAKAHQEQECWYHAGQAEDVQEQQVQESSLVRFNRASVTAQKGVDAVLLGNYQQAIKLLDESLVTYDPALIRGRARLLAQKAEAYYGLGAIEACTASASEALTLGRSAGSGKTIARVRSLHTTLAQSSWGKESGIAQLGEMLARV